MAGARRLDRGLVGRRRPDGQRNARGRPDVRRGAPGGLVGPGAEDVVVLIHSARVRSILRPLHTDYQEEAVSLDIGTEGFVVQPRLAGHGPTLFAGLSRHLDLQIVSRLEFSSGAVAKRYQPIG